MQDYLVIIFLVLLIVYNINLTQALPTQVQQILRNPIVKVLTLICIFVFATRFPSVALLLLIAYILSHSYSQTSNASDSIIHMASTH